MAKLTQEQIEKLQAPLPDWAVKAHPTKTGMSAIHPMSIIDRLNEVFGMGVWQFTTEFLSIEERTQKTKNGERQVFMSAVKGQLAIPDFGIILEQFGGSTNDDKGDALKGGGTDALTKIASYLGIGAEIYKGKGNTAPAKKNATVSLVAPQKATIKPFESARTAISTADTLEDLIKVKEQITKSKLLTSEEKTELTAILVNKTQGFDPL